MTVNWQAVQVVVFDAVGTVMRARPSVTEAYFSAGRSHGSRYTAAEVAERFHSAFHQFHGLPRQEEIIDDAVERERWRQTVALVFDDVTERADALFESLWRHFGDPQNWAAFDDVHVSMRGLRASGREVAIGSNFDQRLNRIAAVHFPDCRVFCSSRLRAVKPDPQFFRRVAKELGRRPEALLMVGDDWENDYLGARRAGWQALFLDRDDKSPQIEDRIASLAAIVPSSP